MAKISSLMHPEQLLLLFNYALFMIPSITSQICNIPQQGDPIVEISTSQPVNSSSVSRLLNLTCTARLTDNSLLAKNPDYRPGSILWWGPQNKIARECLAGPKPDKVMNCILVLDTLNEGTIGNYTCQASTVDSLCTIKTIEIEFSIDIQTPKIIRVPMNHSAGIGSIATFHCTVSGYPMPTIIWTKDNDTISLQSNSRKKVVTDFQKGHSQLVIAGVKSEDYGEYRCVAKNRAGSRTSKAARLYPKTIDIETPEIVEVPLNRSANIGSNVTFNCTAIGDPKPTITWIKYNDTDFPKNNPRTKVVPDLEKGHSQLIIIGVANEDYGKYHCVARNSAGEKTSRTAFLSPEIAAPNTSSKSPIALKDSSSNVTAIVLPWVVLATILMVICGIVGLLWYRRSRCLNEIRDVEMIQMPAVPSTDSVEPTVSMEAELAPSEARFLQNKTENTYATIDPPTPCTPAQDQEKVQLLSVKNEFVPGTDLLPGAIRDVLSIRKLKKPRELPPTPNEDVLPKRPPKPKRKDHRKEQVVCSCMFHSRSQVPGREKSDTLNSQDSGYDSMESRESIFVEQDMVVDGERKSSLSSNENEQNWEIDLERLEVFEEVLGEGEFGVVKRGRYHGQDETIVDVAVKQLKDTTSMTDKADLLSEIKILKQAGRHPNIVNLVGACTQKEKILVVTELIPGGSLESFLKSKRIEYFSSERSKYANVHSGLNDRDLCKIALQIALGMRHLEEKKCIHRDLAARNVFIDKNNVAKVGDFGMARDISDNGIYTKTSSGKVPWRWLSIESLKEQVYTSRSDVWSFGIVLWEIATYGEEPYPDIATPADLITLLSRGYRMSCPKHCSEELYEMMCSCWIENPLMRPTFAGITKRLEYYLRDFEKEYINIETKWHF